MVDEGCNQITTVGFLLGDATLAAAKANKDVDFAIVDFAYEKAPKNLKGLVFNTAEPSFLAGYLAAAKSETGTVGTFGGLNIPTVTSFMTGFMQGVEKFNEDTGGDVQLLGWDGTDGSFTEDFEDKSKGQNIAEGFIQQGADVIMPVAGPAGLGGLQAAQDNDVWGIWVDTNGCESAAEYCDVAADLGHQGHGRRGDRGDRGVGRRQLLQRALRGHAGERRRRSGAVRRRRGRRRPRGHPRGSEAADHRRGHHHRLIANEIWHEAGAGSVPRSGLVVLRFSSLGGRGCISTHRAEQATQASIAPRGAA